ncbi:PTS system, mannose-specific IIA component [Malonomonas rubra DSM 5091]|uniref:PTS system, mannose-specific IIA component n=1 Tax=Malonomonas rubra DSM 5091 TaxID=1122189 RepID=A0A1M6DXE0_MALRU|nr:PTS system fructose subfamily IIA component [Malonomonas rubra]SHI77947.1 PTS system, mannose-specific IIA component [Malonomonas rubra DSM 5091]
MIGIIVVTHAQLAGEFINAAELIIGPAEKLLAVSIDRSSALEAAQEQLSHSVQIVGEDGDGVLILTDMFGGTPTNISAELLSPGKVEIVTGVNLPLLLKAISGRRSQALEALAAMLKDYGRSAVMRPMEML